MKEVDLPEETDICKPVCVHNTNHCGKKVKSYVRREKSTVSLFQAAQ